METSLFSQIKITLENASRLRWLVLVVFAICSFLSLFVGMHFPKVYKSSVTVFVEEQNILGPLMEGAAVQTEVAIDRARIAKEIIYGRTFIGEILDKGGWHDEEMSEEEKDKLVEKTKQNITIENFKSNLIKVEYQGMNPDEVFQTTQLLAETFITESLKQKIRESRSAFEFIESQSNKYRLKLQSSEEKLNQFFDKNADVSPDSEQSIIQRVSELRTNLGQGQQQLREAEIRRDSLKKQLTGEAEESNQLTRAGGYRARISELEAQLDTLRLSYHDTHPDIVQLNRQIEDLRIVVAEEEKRSRLEKKQIGSSAAVVVDEKLLVNPVYQLLRQNYYESNTQITTLQSRLAQIQSMIDQELARSKLVHKLSSDLIELRRDYDANKGIYQDLLRRREIARVSMNLDEEQKGLTMRIDEPAFFPHKPAGPGLIVFILVGWVLGLLLPIGVLFLKVKLQNRIYDPLFLSQQMGLPVLAAVGYMETMTERRRKAASTFGFFTLTLLVISAVIAVAIMHVQGLLSL